MSSQCVWSLLSIGFLVWKPPQWIKTKKSVWLTGQQSSIWHQTKQAAKWFRDWWGTWGSQTEIHVLNWVIVKSVMTGDKVKEIMRKCFYYVITEKRAKCKLGHYCWEWGVKEWMCVIETGNPGRLKLQSNALVSLEKSKPKEKINTYVEEFKILSSKGSFGLTC